MPSFPKIVARTLRSPYLLLVLTTIFWSGHWIVGRGLNETMPPIALSFWRWALATALFVPFVARQMVRQRAVIGHEWRSLTVFALLGVASFSTLTYFGLQTTTAINGALINSSSPVFIFAITWVAFGQRATLRQAIGVAVSLFGVAIIITKGHPAALLALDIVRGDIWVLSAVIAWCVYSVLLKHLPTALPPNVFLGTIMVFGTTVLAALYAWELTQGKVAIYDRAAIGGIVYLALFSSIGAYVCWNRAVRQVGAARAGMFLHLVPLFTSIAAIPLLGEELRLSHVGGMALILAGIYVATATRLWRRRGHEA